MVKGHPIFGESYFNGSATSFQASGDLPPGRVIPRDVQERVNWSNVVATLPTALRDYDVSSYEVNLEDTSPSDWARRGVTGDPAEERRGVTSAFETRGPNGEIYGVFDNPRFLEYLKERYDGLDNSYTTDHLSKEDLIAAAERFYGAERLYDKANGGYTPDEINTKAERFMNDNKMNHDNFEAGDFWTTVAAGAAVGGILGNIPGAIIGAAVGAIGYGLFGSDDDGLSKEDIAFAQAHQGNVSSINDPKFLQFVTDQWEAGNSAIYNDNANGTLNETDMANAVQLWNATHGEQHGYITPDKTHFKGAFENLADAYDNWGIDDNVEIEDLRERLRHSPASQRQYSYGSRY